MKDQIKWLIDFYGDSGLDWVVLTTNNIIHVRDEWPMGNQDFLTYLNENIHRSRVIKHSSL